MTEQQEKIVKMHERGILTEPEAVSALVATGMDGIEAYGHISGELDTTPE